MDQEQKEMATVGGIAFLLCCCLFVVCFSSKEKKSIETDKNNFQLSNTNTKSSKLVKGQRNTSFSGSSGGIARSSYTSSSSSSSNKKVVKNQLSKERLERIIAFQEKAKKQQQEWVKNHIKELLKNPDTPPKIRLKAQLVSNKNYVMAFKAHKNHEYKEAIEYYLNILNDKNASPEIKYIASEYLLDCAQATSDLELFLKVARLEGNLIAKNDLSILNVKKGNSYLKWVDEFESYMKARKDASYKSKLVSELAKRTFRTQQDAERVLNDRISMYERIYKDLLKNA